MKKNPISRRLDPGLVSLNLSLQKVIAMLPQRILMQPLALVLLLLCLINSPAYSAVYYVRQSGSDTNNGLSKNHAFRTIQKAIQTASGNTKIYIGAGEYAEAVARSFNSSNRGTFELIGDTDGKKTGDAGQVTVQALNNQWAIRLYHLQRFEISNIHFEAADDPTKAQGCYVYGSLESTQVDNCSFSEMRYGAYIHTSATSSITNCQFDNITVRATVAYRGDEHLVSNCTFSECHYGVHSNVIPKCTVSDSTFNTQPDDEGKLRLNYAIQAFSTDLVVSDCELTNPHVGIGTNHLTSGTVQKVTINKPRSWAVSLIGTDLSADNVTILGPEDARRGHGLRMYDLDGEEPSIKKCELRGLHLAFYAENNRYQFKHLTIEDNTYGLFVERKADDFRLSNSDQIDISDNYIGIHSRHTKDQPGSISLDRITVENNDFGVLCYDSSIYAEDCTFRSNAIGMRCDRAPVAEIKKSKFLANTERRSWHHYGLQLSAESCEVSDCEFAENQTGFRLANLTEDLPDLEDLTFEDNSHIALDVVHGNIQLDDSSNIKIVGGDHGLVLRHASGEISKLSFPVGQLRPITVYKGKLALSDMQFEQGRIGVHGNASEISVARCNFEAFTHSGIYTWNCPPATIEDCHFESNGSFAVNLTRTRGLTMRNCDLLKSTHYGLFVNSPKKGDCQLELTNNTFAENRYGLRGIRVDFDSTTSKANTFRDNAHGLRIEYGATTLAKDNDNRLTGNNYAVLNYHGRLTVEGLRTSGNTNALYSFKSDTKISDCELQPLGYGLISYSGRTEVDKFSVNGGRFGIHLSPRKNASNQIKLSNLTFTNLSNNGVHIHKHGQKVPNVSVTDMRVAGCRHGIYANGTNLDVQRCQIDRASSYALYQVRGDATFRNLQITNSLHWGVVNQGGEIELNNCSIQSRYGVYLNSRLAVLMNNVIKGSTYGVYTRNKDGVYHVLQSTIGGITHYGVLHNAGDLTLRNSIVQAERYAIWNRSSTGKFEHDHNLVKADRTYVNELPGLNEIEKDPIFVDPIAGDFHLASGSPAINAGTDLSSLTVTDYDGNARPAFRQFEMGAFEYTSEEGSLRVLDWDEKAH